MFISELKCRMRERAKMKNKMLRVNCVVTFKTESMLHAVQLCHINGNNPEVQINKKRFEKDKR